MTDTSRPSTSDGLRSVYGSAEGATGRLPPRSYAGGTMRHFFGFGAARHAAPRHPRYLRLCSPFIAAAAVAVVAGALIATGPSAQAAVGFPIESLDGSGNNVANSTWGQAGTPYTRVLPARYADGRSQPVAGPNTRLVSNRIFNDKFQNIFSEDRISQWGWTWGQFLDHTFGLAQGGTQTANIPFNGSDPLESFTDTLGVIP